MGQVSRIYYLHTIGISSKNIFHDLFANWSGVSAFGGCRHGNLGCIFFICVHCARAPDDAEWYEICICLMKHGPWSGSSVRMHTCAPTFHASCQEYKKTPDHGQSADLTMASAKVQLKWSFQWLESPMDASVEDDVSWPNLKLNLD